MAWTEPKTDWDRNSRFDKNDFNRIKNNLYYLKELAYTLYEVFGYTDLGADRSYSDYVYADEINEIENNLHRISESTLMLDIGIKKEYFPNQAFINYEELNRIEKAGLRLYELLIGQDTGKKRLAFTLGGADFG
jgi:hypothetical protein